MYGAVSIHVPVVDDRGAKHNLVSWESDEGYVARGRVVAPAYKPEWDDELEEMNRGKVGRPFKYSNVMMGYVAACGVVLGIGYHACEGCLEAAWGKDRAPDYSTLWKRIGNTMPKFEVCKVFDHMRGITIRSVADSTGVKLGNGGEWIRVMWKVGGGFFKMYVFVDLDTRRMLVFNLTDAKGGDAAHLPGLPCRALGRCAGRGVSLAE